MAGLRARGHRHVSSLNDPVELAARVADIARAGDFVVCLGAGNITNWAQVLPEELEHILGATSNNPALKDPVSATDKPGALNQNELSPVLEQSNEPTDTDTAEGER